MAYTCNGNGNCDHARFDECEYHDLRVRSAVHVVIGDLSREAQRISDACVSGDVPTSEELKRGAEFEAAFWRGIEKRLEAESHRLTKLRGDRDDLLKACERCVGELVYAAEKLPHSNAREALAIVRKAIAVAHGRALTTIKANPT